MKSRTSTSQPFGFSSYLRVNYSSHLLIILFLFSAFFSFAGENNNPTNTFSPLTGTESMRTNLYLLNDNNTTILADGVLTEYNVLFHDSVNFEDAYKFTNIDENLGLCRYGRVLTVERRPVIAANDTLFFKLWKTTRRKYQFEFVPINISHPGMLAFLEDSYLATRTPLSLTGTTKLNFAVNADSGSANVNRFKIVYQPGSAASPLPVSFTSIKGYQLNSKVSVEWKVDNEINIDKYEVERSSTGTDFAKANAIIVKGLNNAFNSYSWIDENPFKGNNFYRIVSIDRDGTTKYSPIIKVNTGKTTSGSITIYPNPIVNGVINLQFSNQPIGIYQVRMISNSGQVVFAGKLPVTSGNMSQTFSAGKKLPVGIYQMEIKAPDNTINIKKAVVQE